MHLNDKQLKNAFGTTLEQGGLSSARNRMMMAVGQRAIPARVMMQEVSHGLSLWRAAAVGAMAVAVSLLSLAGYATHAAPGDALYQAKLFSERLALSWQTSPLAEAAYHLRLAQNRLAETEALLDGVANGNPADTGLTKSLAYLSLATKVEIANAQENLHVARISSDEGAQGKFAEMVRIAASVSGQTSAVARRIAALPTTQTINGQGTAVAATFPVADSERNETKALSVLAGAVRQSGPKAEASATQTLKKGIDTYIKKQEKKIVSLQAASLTEAQAAQSALKKAEALAKEEKYDEAVEQLELSDDLVKGGDRAADNVDNEKRITGDGEIAPPKETGTP